MTKVNDPAPTSPVMGNKEHKVIFQVSAADPAEQLMVVGQLRNILKALPNCKGCVGQCY